MFGKLSSFKRASRSQAKTGFFLRPLGTLKARYLLCFRALGRSGATLDRFGVIWAALWAPPGHIGSILQPFWDTLTAIGDA